MKSTASIGLRVNYGMQAFYRAHGIEPCCGMCSHFQVTPYNVEAGYRFCEKQGKYVQDHNICYAPQRAPGADDN